MLDIIEKTAGYEVSFQYKPWLVAAVKQIPKAQFNPVKKHWFIPRSSEAALLNWAKAFRVAPRKPVDIGIIPELPELKINIPLLQEMFPYQKRGAAYSIQNKRVIIGDEPGLGKTVQAIATVTALQSRCVLVICPATVKEVWKREIKKWTGKDSLVLSDRVKASWMQYYNVGMISFFICNYESLKKYFVKEINVPEGQALRLNHITFNSTINLFDAVIVDEVHRCKDGKTQAAKFTMGITRNKPVVLGLTGTAVLKNPMDLVAQLRIINRLDDFGGYKAFSDTYCAGAKQASNLAQLNYELNTKCFFRREKKEVLKELPDKMRNIILCEMENRAEYQKAENNFIAYLRENLGKDDQQITTALRGQAMVLIGILKKIAARGKINDVVEHVQEVTDAGEKIIIFAWHKEIVAELKKNIPGSVTIVGDDSLQERQKAQDSFQNNATVKVIICNIKSGGVGITLTASSRVGFIELPWHDADCTQCEDRAHRIGQKDSVQCSYFLAKDSIDEYIYQLIEDKRKVSRAIMGDKNQIETETRLIDEFIIRFAKAKNIN